ncbi:heavy metal translocating P-type ATPase metal-binding domain-containing protein [Sulfuriroseicoccus oceanibius]|uniref:Heavy metal translocating P-type ATPase metal-binding domain-containing protein n=1 Tax=Sulfuriroseicoccus oceanibius TaxID=2707525 RepID=A0A6B3LBQ5_9BACT|nr:heavy metal translocating P-type ATPase metal-binding domain-containing protein [Sulfuriroseicoccus oceanibius]QQL46085.1 heavy metal translocating P-type ATPase metal-binding domain-containing protein [Sulfuriroseicoccus oceanibius]
MAQSPEHDTKPCRHCGTPFTPASTDDAFCCSGCEYVYQLIHEEGLQRFYDFKGKSNLPPVRGKVFDEADFPWLKEAVAVAEQQALDDGRSTGLLQLKAHLDGVTCVGCVWLVERIASKVEGVAAPDLAPASGEITVRWEVGKSDALMQLAGELLRFGYRLTPLGERESRSRELRDLQIRAGMCGALALNGMAFTLPRYLGMPEDFMFAGVFDWIIVLSATLAFFSGGSYFIRRALVSLRARIIHMDVPIALGVTVAFLGSFVGWMTGHSGLFYFDFVSIFLFLMLGGRCIQLMAVNRQRADAEKQTLRPDAVRAAGSGERVESGDLVKGMRYEVDPGGVVPIASSVVDRDVTCSLEWITGESEAREWKVGAQLPAGAINLGRSVATFEAEEDWEGSMLERMGDGREGTPRNPILEKTLAIYVAVVMVIAIVGGVVWWARSGDPITSLQVFVSVLVVSCPCALGVSMPLADDLARMRAQSAGIFIRRENLWGRLKKVRAIWFDKTGTLTMELPSLVNPEAVKRLDDSGAYALAALTAGSVHPVARSLRDTLGVRGQKMRDAGARADAASVDDYPGLGVAWRDQSGRVWRLGRPSWAADEAPAGVDSVLACDGRVVEAFQLVDGARPQSVAAVDWMAGRGYQVGIVSGDRPEKVDHIGDSLGVAPQHRRAGFLPEEKAQLIKAEEAAGRPVLFVGDGANDALACDEATVSATVVSDRAALADRADFCVFGQGMAYLQTLWRIADVRGRAVMRAFVFAVVYNLAAISLCLMGLMHPLIAAIIMPVGSVLSLAIVAGSFRQLRR